MADYFRRIRGIKYLIKEEKHRIQIIKGIIERTKVRIEEFRAIVSDPKLTKDLNHPLFKEAEATKQEAYYRLGESKYFLGECIRDLNLSYRRLRNYESWMIPLIS